MQRHFFQIVDKSPWPLLSVISLFFFLIGIIFYFNGIFLCFILFLFGFFFLLFIMYSWWCDLIREGNYLGVYTKKVYYNFKLGFIIFILTELFLFSCFFWTFFYYSLVPSFFLGAIWPPENIVVMDVYIVPLLNSFILLYSGLTLTIVHNVILKGINERFKDFYWSNNYFLYFNSINFVNYNLFVKKDLFFFFWNLKKKIIIILFFIITIISGFSFLLFQIIEYINSPFSFTDSIFGSCFFLITGFHGIHVIVGLIFIIVNFFRFYINGLESKNHIGFESAVWYWHFVDLIWLFVFIFIYCWGCY